MKGTILIFSLFLITLNLFSQSNNFCLTPSPKGIPLSIAGTSPYVDLNTVDTVDIGIAFHIVSYSNGSGALDTSRIDTILSILNSAFSGAKIRFFNRKINFIANDTFANPFSSDYSMRIQ